VLVTGAARGLGEAFARALVDAGAQVVSATCCTSVAQRWPQELGTAGPLRADGPVGRRLDQAGVDAAAAAWGAWTA
jgi:NAD(P)-dependent dehydrogenase (short-subunit alcohol dehydrogenase family)